MKIVLKALVVMLLLGTDFQANAANTIDEWKILLVPEQTDAELNSQTENTLIPLLTQHPVSVIASESLDLNCGVAFCGSASLFDLKNKLNTSFLNEDSAVTTPNIILVYRIYAKENQNLFDVQAISTVTATLQLRAIDPVSGVVSYTKKRTITGSGDNAKASSEVLENTSKELASLLGNELLTELLNKDTRFTFELDLQGFSPQETRVLSSLLMPSASNIQADLQREVTRRSLVQFLLPIQSVQYKVNSPYSPAQFRQQTIQLTERMGAPTDIRFVQQENKFLIERASSPYLVETFLLWIASILAIYAVVIFSVRAILDNKLSRYTLANQSGKWLRLFNVVETLPLPLLVRQSWRDHKQSIEKRIEQSNRWFENATHLLHNYEVDSASVYVNRAIEQNASNISAVALASAINEQRERNKEIKDERKEWKHRVESAVKLAQQGQFYHALTSAYDALALCKSHAVHRRPVIDLQIDSINRLLARLVKGKSIKGKGLAIRSLHQKVIINGNRKLHIGRPSETSNLNMAIQLVLPQSNLSRVGRSIVVESDEYGYQLQDLGSTNGAWLQYVKIETKHTHRLSPMDQIHLLPPDELGSIGIQVEHVHKNECLCLSLCQNGIMPNVNKSDTVGFLAASAYRDTRWYLTNDDFFLVKTPQGLRWFSRTQWKEKQDSKGANKSSLPLLRLQSADSAWLFPLFTQSMPEEGGEQILINGTRLNGPMPLQETVTLKVGNEVFTINLYEADVASNEAENTIITDTVYTDVENDDKSYSVATKSLNAKTGSPVKQ